MNQTENKCGARCSALGKWAIVAVVLALALVVLTWASAERRKNILQTASALPECSTFVELVDKAGLGPTLAKDGPFTVFVPTNEAFAKVSQERLTQLLNDKSALASILLYHMTPEALTIEQISAPTTRDTCVVPKTPIACSGEKYGDAVYIQKNIPCVNGVVYIIDSVQIPPFLAGAFAPPLDSSTGAPVGAPNATSTPVPAPIRTPTSAEPTPTPTPNEPQTPQADSTPTAEIGAVEVVATEEIAEPTASAAQPVGDASAKTDEPKKPEAVGESTEKAEKADESKAEPTATPEKPVENPADESTEKAEKADEPEKSPSDAPSVAANSPVSAN